jgi:hypothetical protein
MTITLENQYICAFNIGPYKDFILVEDLEELLYIETAGDVLPYVKVAFILRDVKVLDYLNEGNVLNVSIGRTQLDLIDLQFRLISDNSQKVVSLGQKITIEGVLSLPAFDQLEKTDSFPEDSSINFIKKIASRHFNVVTNIERTHDKQTYLQASQTDREVIKDAWMCSYVGENTFIAMAYDSHKLYLKDIGKALMTEVPWVFSSVTASGEASRIINFSSYKIKNQYGVINDAIGRNVTNIATNTDLGVAMAPEDRLKNLTLLGSTKINQAYLGSSRNNFLFANTNVHPNYVKSTLQNLRNLLLYSSLQIFISFSGQFKQLSLLDIVNLDFNSVDKRIAGRAIVSCITYQLIDRRLVTNVILCKEGANEIKGDLK